MIVQVPALTIVARPAEVTVQPLVVLELKFTASPLVAVAATVKVRLGPYTCEAGVAKLMVWFCFGGAPHG